MNDKKLRSDIMAISNLKYGWDYDEFHEIMEEWGYGNSLRALETSSLKHLKWQLMGIQEDDDRWELDAQGKYMWFLLCESGWSKKRLIIFMIKKYHKNNWNLLTKKERRGVINMLKIYYKESNK